MSNLSNTSERIKQYFRVKSRQLAAISELPNCEHSGLIGSHREQIQRVYLSEILPKRYEVGRGMVYGPLHRSREADIVIWDSFNYPSLPLSDHSFFFANSVRAVLECKSSWSSAEFRDVLVKCEAVRDIVPVPGLTLIDGIAAIEQQIVALKENRVYEGMLTAPHHIGTAAIFLEGGQGITEDWVRGTILHELDNVWPDVLLFLQTGRVVIKNYQATGGFGGYGWLDFYDARDDALLIFTASLLNLITDKSVQLESPFLFSGYVPEMLALEPNATIDFSLSRPPPQRTPIWRSEFD